jgi:hypothetical protein
MNVKLLEIIDKYIKLTPEKSFVKISQIRLSDFIDNKNILSRVYLSTRSLKHVYDKRPAEEFDKCISLINIAIKSYSYIYDNSSKSGKRGDIMIVLKDVDGVLYSVILEKKEKTYNVVTFFRVRKEDYLSSYKLVWSREVGTPLS